MSFILDALKKSESERRSQQDSGFASVPIADSRARNPVWLWVVAALLLINVVVLTGLLLRSNGSDSASSSADATQPVEAAVVANPQPQSAPDFERRVQDARRERPTPVAPAESLAAEAPAADSEFVPTPQVVVSSPPAMSEPVAATVGTVTVPGRVVDELPQLDELRASGDIDVDSLRLDIHVFSERPADRFVFINMVKHREGSTTADGLTVREILPDGVVLDWRGREFILPRQ